MKEWKRTYLVVLICFTILFFSVTLVSVSILYYYYSSSVDANEIIEHGYYYKFFESNSHHKNEDEEEGNIVIPRALLRFDRELSFDEGKSHVTFFDEETGSMNMISKFDMSKNDYQCTGSCYCLEKNDNDERRNTMTLRKSLIYFVSSVSSLVAMKRASEYFDEECSHSLVSEKCPSDAILSEVQNCEDLDQSDSENDNKKATERKRHSVLFVCLANMCRSPMCECIFREMDKKDEWEVDSCGTLGQYFEGQPPNPHTMDVLKEKFGEDLEFETTSRGFKEDDFYRFDYILCMDNRNVNDCLGIAKGFDLDESKNKAKIMKITDFSNGKYDEVQDPFRKGFADFEEVYQVCTDCCKGMLKEVEEE